MRRIRSATSSSSICPRLARTVKAGKVFGSVESVKAVSDLYSPVSGTVTAVNEELTSAPEKINTDAHAVVDHESEICRMQPMLDALLDSAAYEKFIAEETGH